MFTLEQLQRLKVNADLKLTGLNTSYQSKTNAIEQMQVEKDALVIEINEWQAVVEELATQIQSMENV